MAAAIGVANEVPDLYMVCFFHRELTATPRVVKLSFFFIGLGLISPLFPFPSHACIHMTLGFRPGRDRPRLPPSLDAAANMSLSALKALSMASSIALFWSSKPNDMEMMWT